ncbi:Gfo/Idh/MocA family protein [Neobacillus niacini]|uniref:Gfo/Idh/MocA family protein n=1 Tax=Neobacillus niacini TaxID=86668 RepID=UPI0005EF7956|nr:Gfo/Idh/MocA family oxidoreductase [Neobacillus niacini]
MENLKIGMIGLDSSHCIEFTKLLNDTHHPFHVNGGVIHAVYPFFSENLPISKNRVQQFKETLELNFDLHMAHSIQELAQSCDAILITAVDGDKHLALFKELLPYKIPVFIDKPLTLSLEEAEEIFSLSQKYQIPVMSCSSLRFAESFYKHLVQLQEEVKSLYVHGPLPMQENIPGYFWYGIHVVEMVIAAMGTKVKNINVFKNSQYETIVFEWNDGRHAVIHGEYEWHPRFGVTLHTDQCFYNADIEKDVKPFYASLLEEIVCFFKTRNSPVPAEETLEIISLCSQINKIRNELL